MMMRTTANLFHIKGMNKKLEQVELELSLFQLFIAEGSFDETLF